MKANVFQFAEFAGAASNQKIAIARQYARQSGAFDPYAAVRHAITELHRDGTPSSELKARLRRVNIKNVDLVRIFDSYLSWLGNTPYRWSPIDAVRSWSSANVVVPVPVELSLDLRGRQYVIKPYFKVDALGARTADNVLNILGATYRDELRSGARIAVLDVARELPFFLKSPPRSETRIFLESEAVSFDAMVEAFREEMRRTA